MPRATAVATTQVTPVTPAETTAPRVRSRVVPARSLQLNPVANDPVTEEMRSLAHTAFTKRREEYRAKSEADKAVKTLNALMEKAGVPSFDIDVNGTKVDAVIEGGEKAYVDVEVLKTLVDDKTFLRIVSAMQGAVKEEAGTNTLMKCLRTAPTAPTLKVRERK